MERNLRSEASLVRRTNREEVVGSGKCFSGELVTVIRGVTGCQPFAPTRRTDLSPNPPMTITRPSFSRSETGAARAWFMGEVSVQSRECQSYISLSALRRAGAGEPQACCGEAAAHRTSAGCDSRGVIDRAGTDAAPLPQQTSVLGLLRAGLGDAQQRRLPLRGRTTGARQETGVHPRTQPQPQSRSEKPV